QGQLAGGSDLMIGDGKEPETLLNIEQDTPSIEKATLTETAEGGLPAKRTEFKERQRLPLDPLTKPARHSDQPCRDQRPHQASLETIPHQRARTPACASVLAAQA